MIGTCEPHELVEVVGPLIARTLTLWDLLLLRLDSMDRAKAKADGAPEEGPAEEETRERANSNRVTWLLMELRALLDSVQSIAGDLLKPRGVSDCAVDNVVEVSGFSFEVEPLGARKKVTLSKLKFPDDNFYLVAVPKKL